MYHTSAVVHVHASYKYCNSCIIQVTVHATFFLFHLLLYIVFLVDLRHKVTLLCCTRRLSMLARASCSPIPKPYYYYDYANPTLEQENAGPLSASFPSHSSASFSLIPKPL